METAIGAETILQPTIVDGRIPHILDRLRCPWTFLFRMKRRILLSALASLCALLSAGVSRSESARPNIILIIADDHVWTHYGFMGHKIVKTPHLDRMAGESLLYTRGYATPVCSPSLATLLTGLYPREHGITGNDLFAENRKAAQSLGSSRDPLRERLLANPLILPKALSEAGYLTFQTGKLWNTSYEEVGFTHGMTKERSRHGGAGLTIGRNGMEPVYQFIGIARSADKPFFIWHAPLLPHDPHNPPEKFLKKYRGKGPTKHAEVYHAMVEWFDSTCGELDQWLEAKGLKENTVVLYLSDNGWDPDHGYKGSRAKLTPYENGVRTPMFVRWPGKVEPRRDEQTLASIIDFVPTILNMAGVKPPAKLPGLDLRDRESMVARKSIFIEAYRHDIMDIGDPSKSLVGRAVIGGWSKLVLPGPQTHNGSKANFASLAGEIELFDLKSDPFEKNNVALERPEQVVRLKAIQDARWKVD